MTTEPRTAYDPAAYPPPPAGPHGIHPASAYPAPGYAQPGYPSVPQIKVPGIGPVIAFTAIFGVFGAISAARRSGKAKAAGVSGSKYWTAFGITFLAVWAVSGIIALVAGGGKSTAPQTQAAAPVATVAATTASAAPVATVAATQAPAAADAFSAAWLQEEIVANSDFKTSEGETAEVSAATCSAMGVDQSGVGVYQCVIDFASGQRQSQTINVDATGAWVTSA